MFLFLWIAVAILILLLPLVSLVQLLYLESLRLRTRETHAQTFFKQTLEDRIGLQGDAGALPFSLLKHIMLVLLGWSVLGIAAWAGPVNLANATEGAVFGVLIMVLCSYIVPQTLYRRSGGRWLLRLVPLIRGLALLIRPPALVLGFFESVVELGNGRTAAQEPATPANDIEALITAGTEEGIIEEDDRKLIQSVVALKSKTVRESMTARPEMVGIPVDKSLDDLRQLVIHEQYSRIPVYEGSIDRIVGFVHVRDLFELTAEQQASKSIRDLLRHIKHVPETKPVDDLLREMQAEGAHMAVVVDEYGNTAGIATMEDLVEEIVGEIRDEHEPDRDVRREAGDTYVVAGSFDVDRLRELIDFRVEEQTESTTVGGLVTEWLGHVPQPGEHADRGGIRIEVLAASDLRVDQVRVSRPGAAHD